MTIELSLMAVGVALILYVVFLHRDLKQALAYRREPKPLERYPSVSVIRPIKGLDAGAKQNIEAALAHGYPAEVQTIFVLDDEREPATPLVRQAIAEYKKRGGKDDVQLLFCGEPPAGLTGKTNAMIAGLRRATGELLAFADSDIRPDRTVLARLVQTLLGEERAGCAFGPVVVRETPQTLGDVGYTLLLNGLYGAAAAYTTRQRGGDMSFIMGQYMVFTREALAAIGGLESASGQLVDDMYLGARIVAAGYRNVVAPVQIPVVQERLPLKDFASIYRRWITFSRSGLPGWSFKRIAAMHGVVFWTGIVLALGALAAGNALAALVFAMAPLAVSASINDLHHALGGAKLKTAHLFGSFVLLLVAPVVYGSVFFRQSVKWRGRTYDLNASSKLASGNALGPDQHLPIQRGA